MIIGDCPYEGCVGRVWLPICDKPPAFERHLCDECGGAIWTYHSRLDPWSMTETDFLNAYEVNRDTKTVRERQPESKP